MTSQFVAKNATSGTAAAGANASHARFASRRQNQQNSTTPSGNAGSSLQIPHAAKKPAAAAHRVFRRPTSNATHAASVIQNAATPTVWLFSVARNGPVGTASVATTSVTNATSRPVCSRRRTHAAAAHDSTVGSHCTKSSVARVAVAVSASRSQPVTARTHA